MNIEDTVAVTAQNKKKHKFDWKANLILYMVGLLGFICFCVIRNRQNADIQEIAEATMVYTAIYVFFWALIKSLVVLIFCISDIIFPNKKSRTNKVVQSKKWIINPFKNYVNLIDFSNNKSLLIEGYQEKTECKYVEFDKIYITANKEILFKTESERNVFDNHYYLNAFTSNQIEEIIKNFEEKNKDVIVDSALRDVLEPTNSNISHTSDIDVNLSENNKNTKGLRIKKSAQNTTIYALSKQLLKDGFGLIVCALVLSLILYRFLYPMGAFGKCIICVWVIFCILILLSARICVKIRIDKNQVVLGNNKSSFDDIIIPYKQISRIAVLNENVLKIYIREGIDKINDTTFDLDDFKCGEIQVIINLLSTKVPFSIDEQIAKENNYTLPKDALKEESTPNRRRKVTTTAEIIPIKATKKTPQAKRSLELGTSEASDDNKKTKRRLEL